MNLRYLVESGKYDESELSVRDKEYIAGMRHIRSTLDDAVEMYVSNMEEPGLETHNRLIRERLEDARDYIKEYVETEVCEMIVAMLDEQACRETEEEGGRSEAGGKHPSAIPDCGVAGLVNETARNLLEAALRDTMEECPPAGPEYVSGWSAALASLRRKFAGMGCGDSEEGAPAAGGCPGTREKAEPAKTPGQNGSDATEGKGPDGPGGGEPELSGLVENINNCYFDFGAWTGADDFFEELVKRHGSMDKPLGLLEDIAGENRENVHVLEGVLHILSNYDYDKVGEAGLDIVRECSKCPSAVTQEAVIACVEKWEVPEGIEMLEGMDVREAWLCREKEQAVRQLKKTDGRCP